MSDATGATAIAPPAETGSRTDRLELLQQFGGASVGVVHKARNPKLNRALVLRQVQVPEWLDHADDLIKRILAEAQRASALDHANIARLYTGGFKGFTVFLTSEFVEGTNIKEFASSRSLSIPDLIALARQLFAALDHAHDKKVVHYALTPANLKITSDGALKVLDFGLLREKELYSPTPAKRLESEHYLSPEQLKGRPITRAANLFSAATILYELFTTRNPFAGKHLGEVDRNITEVDPNPACVAHTRVPEAVSKVLMKALSRNPLTRFQTGAEFAAALEEAFNSSASKAPMATVPALATARTSVTATAPGRISANAPKKSVPGDSSASAQPNAAATAVAGANGNNHAPKVVPISKPTVVANQATSALPSKMPAKVLTQWKLVGAIIAALFVVSAVAISLNHRSKIASAAPEASQPKEEVAVPSESSPATESQPITPQPIIDLQEVRPKASKQKSAKAGPPPAPAPSADGQLVISSDPEGASIVIEGRTLESWKTPQTVGSLAPAVYKVTLSKPGYASETRSVQVISGGRISLDVRLVALKASLSVAGTPIGARILIDGKETGKFSPADFTLDPAIHTLTLRKEGYFDSTTELKLAAGQAMNYAPNLTPAGRTDNIKVVGGFKKLFGGDSSEGMSRIEIKTEPRGAQVEINGNTLPKATPFEIQLEPGNYEITLQKAGYKPVHKSVTTQANQKMKIEETLAQ